MKLSTMKTLCDQHVRERIGRIDGTIDSFRVQPVLEYRWIPARHDRRAGDTVAPGNGHPLRIEPSGHPVVEVRAIHVVLDVFLARVHDLHRAVDLLCHLHRANDAVDLETPAEASAEQVIVHGDTLQRQPGDLCCCRLGPREHLSANPDVAAVVAHVRRTVHRLHGRVCEKRNLIDRFMARRCR
jgi:hypothetical protein